MRQGEVAAESWIPLYSGSTPSLHPPRRQWNTVRKDGAPSAFQDRPDLFEQWLVKTLRDSHPRVSIICEKDETLLKLLEDKCIDFRQIPSPEESGSLGIRIRNP
jgi:hypothetical protein